MKTIVLVRHSKAVTRTVDVADYYRALKKKGKAESKEMALKFTKIGLVPGLIISSPATRAFETAKEFAKVLKYPEKNIRHEESIYFANNGNEFMGFLQKCEKENKILVLGIFQNSVTQKSEAKNKKGASNSGYSQISTFRNML